MSTRHNAARETAQAVDKVINQMQGGTQKPNLADVLVAHVALHAADRAGVTGPVPSLPGYYRVRGYYPAVTTNDQEQ